MNSGLSPQEEVALALERLKLAFTASYSSDGSRLWNVPFGAPTNVLLTVVAGPLAAIVLNVVGPLPTKLSGKMLELNWELTLGKVLAKDGQVMVVAEIPVGHVDERSLAAAISSALEGVRRVRGLLPTQALLPAP